MGPGVATSPKSYPWNLLASKPITELIFFVGSEIVWYLFGAGLSKTAYGTMDEVSGAFVKLTIGARLKTASF